ncbi:MAG TPA: IPT/TIG domain-containing protein, partial [Acidimicrobiales bacterium]|nr:IPT/TIG domain-containing protein [Acidimicrobiales bacterium]
MIWVSNGRQLKGRGSRTALVALGAAVPLFGLAGALAISAPAGAAGLPAISAVSPDVGPAAGGTTVTVTGTGFTGTTAVHFGSHAAASFDVDSATELTAVSPGGAGVVPGVVDVSVTTSTGATPAVAADRFTYQGSWTAYVTSRSTSSSVTPIDLATGSIGAPIALPATAAPSAVAITPDGVTAYVVGTTGLASPIDVATGTVGTGIVTGDATQAIAVNPDGTAAYAVSATDGRIASISIPGGTSGTVATVGTNLNLVAIAVAPDGRTAYVVSESLGEVIPV